MAAAAVAHCTPAGCARQTEGDTLSRGGRTVHKNSHLPKNELCVEHFNWRISYSSGHVLKCRFFVLCCRIVILLVESSIFYDMKVYLNAED